MGYTKLTEQLSFRVSSTLYDLVEQIAKDERRKPNEVARALLERGAAAFHRDGQLFEPLSVKVNGGESREMPAKSAAELAKEARGRSAGKQRVPVVEMDLAPDKRKK